MHQREHFFLRRSSNLNWRWREKYYPYNILSNFTIIIIIIIIIFYEATFCIHEMFFTRANLVFSGRFFFSHFDNDELHEVTKFYLALRDITVYDSDQPLWKTSMESCQNTLLDLNDFSGFNNIFLIKMRAHRLWLKKVKRRWNFAYKILTFCRVKSPYR